MATNFNLVKKKKEEDEDIEDEEELESSEVENDDDHSSSKTFDKDFKRRIILIMGGAIVLVILMMVILFIASLFTGGKYTYEKVEEIMKNAAISYFNAHPENLPPEGSKPYEIDVLYLVQDGRMKELTHYLGKDAVCTGNVRVQNINGQYVYTPYLNCGDKYLTIELYSKVLKDNEVVTSGDGLYKNGNSYIFRGENVNNYLQLESSLWRIVKITSDNKLYLVNDKGVRYAGQWDNRYNDVKGYESGINDYNVSRIRTFLDKVYTNPSADDGEVILSDNDKAKLVPFNLCIGKRKADSVSRDNSIECGSILKDQNLGLLTLSEYLFVSLDPNCKGPSTKTCLNYNYLVNDTVWWVVTADASNTFNVFKVDRSGVVEPSIASTSGMIRPTIYINNSVMFKSGSGTLEDPYIAK